MPNSSNAKGTGNGARRRLIPSTAMAVSDSLVCSGELKHLMGATQQVLKTMQADGIPQSAAWPLVTNIAMYVKVSVSNQSQTNSSMRSLG